MTHFVIETKNKNIDSEEVFVFFKSLDRFKFLHDFSFCDESDLAHLSLPKDSVIPVGEIPFVQKFLSLYFPNVPMKPLEIPKFLQLPFFLKRDYQVLSFSEIPSAGRFFLKDASKLKSFSYNGHLERIEQNSDITISEINPDTKVVLSESVSFEVEYRCFVRDGDIQGVQFYDGNWLVFPDNGMVDMVKSAAILIQKHLPHLTSYTIDVGLIKDKGWAIIELHPFCAVGLYGFNDYDLCNYYIEGFKFYIEESSLNLLKI